MRFKTDGAGRLTGRTSSGGDLQRQPLTRITAPDGTSIVYDYDEAGNLVGARNLALGDSVRYGYGESGLNLIAGDTGEAVSYFETPVVKAIEEDLGTASAFVGRTITGNGNDLYSFALRESEINSTASGLVLLGVDIGSNEVPVIEGLTPVSSTNGFALFAVEKEGLNLLSVSGDYELQLAIAGDVNGDGKVNGVDSQLLIDAIDNSNYATNLDLNRDGVLNATDVQILGSNYGFTANRAPVVEGTQALTHEDLSVEIPLKDLAEDPEGDGVYFKVAEVEHGTVRFVDGGVIFKPEVGYTGEASFKLFADDGYGVSDAATIEISVSDAPLTGLDFVERNPKLEVGERVQLQVIGDFADEKGLTLPGDYLNWLSESDEVVQVSETGVVIGSGNGTSILTAEKDLISLATAIRVGESSEPTNSAEFYANLAENHALDVFLRSCTKKN